MTAVTGTGRVLLGPEEPGCDPTPWLRERKTRKFLGLQDDMAVVAAGRAVTQAGLGRSLGERTGLYLAVGWIPFQWDDIRAVYEASIEDGRFSMGRFAGGGYERAHPLLTFRCLPNMPAYHVSSSFDVQGPYLVSYPGPGQLYTVLDAACRALDTGAVDRALVGGVAAQRNFLVEHHYGRLERPVPASRLRDAAALLVLERAEDARARGAPVLCHLEAIETRYEPFDPRTTMPDADERLHADDLVLPDEGELGAASLPHAVSAWLGAPGASDRLTHRLRSRDGVIATSTWRRAS